MIWVVGGIAALLFFAWIGRQVRRGRWTAGPWIHQFRTVRSVFGVCLMGTGLLMIARGLWPQGVLMLVVAAALGASVRFHIFGGGPKAQTPPVAAVFNAEEIKAYQTLGLAVGADRKAVKGAWKRLIRAAHPDQGGSVDKASALNAARDVLLKSRR